MLKNKFKPPSYLFNLAGFVFSIFLMFVAALGKDWGYETGGIYRMWIMYEDAPAFFRFIPRFIAWGIPSLLLTFFSVHLENNFKWRIAKFGKYTYSIYLIQVFTNPLAKSLQQIMPDLLAWIMGLIVLFLLSYVSYNYFEKIFIQLKDQLNTRLGVN